jgi:hypothetical protein
MLDDPDDDGRSLVSAAWGSGHDGSAIEIVNVEFVEVSLLLLFSSFGVSLIIIIYF